jgi:hypothetical protein
MVTLFDTEFRYLDACAGLLEVRDVRYGNGAAVWVVALWLLPGCADRLGRAFAK